MKTPNYEDRVQQSSERVRKLVDQFSDEVNTMSDLSAIEMALAQSLTKQHRTLQQALVKVLINGLVMYGDIATTDARNEAAVDECKSMKQVNFPFI